MQTIDLEIRTIDHELKEKLVQAGAGSKTVSINEQAQFTLHTKLKARQPIDCFLDINTETAKAKHTFSGMVDDSADSPIGAFEFNNVYLLGHTGIIADINNRVCWIGYALGWNLNQLKAAVESNQLGEVVDDRVLRLDNTLLQAADAQFAQSGAAAAQLISSPGYAVYGHWLADTVPRLHHRSKHSNLSSAAVYSPRTAAWGIELAGAFGVDLARQPHLNEGTCVRVDTLDLFSCIKSNRVFDGATANAAWDVLREVYANNPEPQGLKLYVSRAKLRTARKIENAAQIEAYIATLGWQVIYPETLSLAEQARIFSRASIIVGEDGSALHNSLYSPPGTKILCLDFQRENMFQASFANALQQKIAYLSCDRVDDNTGRALWTMPIPRLSEALHLVDVG